MDINVLLWFQEHRCGFLDGIMKFFTLLGNEVVGVGLVCLFFWCFNKKEGNRMMLTMFSGLMMSQLLKIIFAVGRPWIRDSRVKPLGSVETVTENGKIKLTGGAIGDATSYSFPSGHTANAVSCYVGYPYGKKGFTWLKVLGWILVICIGLSRMYLGVHTPQDVLVSIAVGVVLVYLMDKFSELLERKPDTDIAIASGALFLCAATLIIALIRMGGQPADENTIDVFKLSGATIGCAAGWLMERRLIRFSEPETVLKGIIRFVVGLALVLAVMKLPKALLNRACGEIVGSILRYSLTCFVAMYVYPLLFTKLKF